MNPAVYIRPCEPQSPGDLRHPTLGAHTVRRGANRLLEAHEKMRDEDRSEAVGRNPDEVRKEGLGFACTATLRVLACTRRSEIAPATR